MFPSLMFLVLGVTQYGPEQAHSDSMFIYSTYTESAKFFKQATEPGQWKAVDDSVTKVTAAAFLRLHRYNKESYKPIDELNRETVGVALVFPLPLGLSSPDNSKAEITEKNAPAPTLEIAFKVLDEQTHFLIPANGKGRIPYITMNYYAKGRILVKSEKLNPVTHLPIEIPTVGPGLATSSN